MPSPTTDLKPPSFKFREGGMYRATGLTGWAKSHLFLIPLPLEQTVLGITQGLVATTSPKFF